MYYWLDGDSVICSDSLRHLVAMVGRLELDPDAVPQHLLYRTVAGDMTYYRGIRKLLSGQMATYYEGDWQIQQVERLDDWAPQNTVSSVSSQTVAAFDHKAEQIVGSYVEQVTELGHELGIFLSGGVDSSLLVSLVKPSLPSRRLQSISYAMRVPSFEDEVRYAQSAVDTLGTEHLFVDITPDDYVRLLQQMIELLAQPVDNEQDPCYLALAQVLSGQEPHYLFSGSAADTLLGNEDARRLLQVEQLRRIPGSRHALSHLGQALKRLWPNKAYGMREAAYILSSLNDPLSPHHPMHRQSMFSNLDRAQMCLGAETIRDALAYRLSTFRTYSSAPSILEGMHLIELTHDVHDEEAVTLQAFRAYDLEIVAPYLDSEFVQAVLAFEPHVRFYAQGRPKWLPKQLLENRLGPETQLTQQPKRAGGFDDELRQWMKDGVLADLVHSIERPGYMSQSDFERVLEQPDWFTWNLLTMDLFQKTYLKT
jgi:asparagine synthetase B (glutamine-hydrolysing)